MNENMDIFAALESYRDGIDLLLSKIEELEARSDAQGKRIKQLESTIFDDIINPAQAAFDEADRRERHDGFMGKFADRLGEYNTPLRSIEGEDFDLAEQAFEGYDSLTGEDKPTDDEYVEELIKQVAAQLDQIKSAMGEPKAEEPEVKTRTIIEEGSTDKKEDEEEPEDEMAALIAELEKAR